MCEKEHPKEWWAITFRDGPIELNCGCLLVVDRKGVTVERTCWILRELLRARSKYDIDPDLIAQTHCCLHCTEGRYLEWVASWSPKTTS
jgi:hypothetical protein